MKLIYAVFNHLFPVRNQPEREFSVREFLQEGPVGIIPLVMLWEQVLTEISRCALHYNKVNRIRVEYRPNAEPPHFGVSGMGAQEYTIFRSC